MKNIKIKASGKYLPKRKITNNVLSENLNVSTDFIESRTGISTRYYAIDETISELTIDSIKSMLNKSDINITETELIIVATTSTDRLMPGISYLIQKEFKIKECICMDILAGCAGFINAMDIAKLYLSTGKCKNALVIGADKLTTYLDMSDVSTSIILSDGAGVIYLEATEEDKLYDSYILADGKRSSLLTCNINENIYMNGKEIYKYAITETVSVLSKLLEKNKLDVNDIDYFVFHQSNLRILESIRKRLNISEEKMFNNISKYGNTFCASIPILLDDLFESKRIKQGSKILLMGYGGGLNTGSILMEV